MSASKVVTKISLILAVAAFFATAAPVEAQNKKNSGKSQKVGDLLKRIEANTKKVKFSKKSSAVPKFKKLEERAAKPVNLSQIKPPSRSTLYYAEGTNERELEQITDEGIAQLYKLTQQFKNSKKRGELWLRLAELYVEKSRLIEYRLQQDYDDQLKKFQEGQTKKKPVLNLANAQEYNRKSIQLYEWFLRDFPKDQKVDQALFFLGYNYFELNKSEVGKDYYQRLTNEFPKSAYIEESNFALGEYHFEREEWKEALKRYEFVAKNKRARLYSFAQYKTAWCQYKTGQVKQALDSLERVIKAGKVAKGSQDGSAGGVSRIRLASEATKDLVVFYAEVGKPQDARSYFEDQVGSKAAFGLMEKLAYYYADTGNRDGARFIFRELIADKPNAPKAYDYQYQIVSMYVSSEKGDVFKEELFNWINTYSPDSAWAKANAKDVELVSKANQLIETTLRNHILQQHQTAQNSRVPTARKAAKEGYDLYFQTFKEGPKQDEMRFFYAELLFDMGEFEAASAQYQWITDNAPNSTYAEKATLNRVLALEKGLPKEEDLKKQIGTSLEPVAFGKNVQDFEVASSAYIKMFPKGENTPAMRYKIGALYYYHNQFDKALDVFNSIIKDYPKSPYAQYSANLTLDIYNLRKDYVGLEKAGQDILTNEDLAKSSVGQQVKGVLQRAEFKKAQDLEAKKDYAGAAAAYEEFTKKNPSGELALTAAFNAAVDYEKAGDPFKAIGMYTLVLAAGKGDKSDELKKNSSKFIGSLYEKTGQYQKAAEAFEQFAAKNPKDKEAVAFWFNAAVIRDGMNSYNQAISNYEKHYELSRAADRAETLWLMAKLYERRGNSAKALELYEQYSKVSGSRNPSNYIEAAYQIAQIHLKKKRLDDVDEWYNKVLFRQKKFSTAENPVGASYAAEAKFHMVSKTFTELRAIKIPNNPAKMKGAVEQKLALLNKLKEQLKDVIKFDDGPMIVSSLVMIGQANQHMAAAIYGVPLPKLDPESMKQYKAGIDAVARPLQDQAVQNYEAAIERGNKLEGYNEALKSAYSELGRLAPEKHAFYDEQAVITKLPDQMDITSDSGLESAYRAKDEKVLIDTVSKMLGKNQDDLKALSALALHYMEAQKFGLARIIWARAEKAHANQPGIHNNLGVISLAEGKQRLAMAYFRKAIEVKSSYPIASANLGSIFVEYKDYAKAVDLLEDGYDSVKRDLRRGVSIDVANNYALALGGSGKLDKAESIFGAILKADSQNTTALLNLSILQIQRKKDKKEGEKTLNKLKFLADDPQTKRRVEELEKALAVN